MYTLYKQRILSFLKMWMLSLPVSQYITANYNFTHINKLKFICIITRKQDQE
jgi:hypothetical protein